MYLRYLDCRLALCNELLLAGSNLKGKRKREKGKKKIPTSRFELETFRM